MSSPARRKAGAPDNYERRLATLSAHVRPCGTSVSIVADTCKTGAGFRVTPLAPGVGADVSGLAIRSLLRQGKGQGSPEVERLRRSVTDHGFLVFRNQTDISDSGRGLSCDELVAFGSWFGCGLLHSSHRVHSCAEHQDVFRVSNDPDVGCFEGTGVGTGGFHSDGYFLPNVYSHAVYQIVSVPHSGKGDTLFASYAAAVRRLAVEFPEELALLRRLQGLCDVSGIVHPLIHSHPSTGDEVLLLGGLAGALEVFRGTVDELLASGVPVQTHTSLEFEEDKTTASWSPLSDAKRRWGLGAKLVAVRPMVKTSLRTLQSFLQRLLSEEGMHYRHRWREGDIIVTDNLQVAHKASKEAGDLAQGLRVLHRVTVAGSKIIQ